MMFVLFFLLLPALLYAEGAMEEIIAGPGDEILLFCPVNTEVCGAYHSLKWYHEDTRVYVFSPSAQFRNAEGALMSRCLDPSQQSLGPTCVRGSLEVTDTSADLRISPVELRDEGEYRCEITYLDISTNCPVVHFTEVLTVAAPESVTITDHEDEAITGQVVGPYAAGEEVAFSCASEGGKPAPAITWMFGDEVLEGDISDEEDKETGSWNVRSELVVMLAREHTGSTLTCIVEHEALDNALEANIQVDVNVPLSSVTIAEEVSGQEGVEMILTCTAVGGRPAPTFSWTMPDNIQFKQEDSSSLSDDETFESVSRLTFIPTHEENVKEVSCQAINDVMDEPLEDKADLFVEYAPQVNIKEGNETAAAGDELLIDCEIHANPGKLSNIQWFHNDNALDIIKDRFHWENTATPSLSITPVQPSDAGVYSCSAENRIGQTRSPLTYNLEVTAPVESVAIQDDLTGTVDEEMTIVCISTGARPVAVVEWVMASTDDLSFEVEEETNLMEDNTYETTSRLILAPHKGLNGMEVSCQATNEVMEEAMEAKAELNILYPPTITIEEENKTVSTGEELIIECDIDANPENLTLVEWYHNGDVLDLTDGRLQGDVPALSFTPVQVSDAGEYYCSAENEVGQGQSHMVKLHVISVVETVMIKDESGIEAEEMVLTCVALGGRPASTITWVMPDNVLFSVEQKVGIIEEETFQTVSKLTFTPSAEENEKKVFCQAINDVMEEAVEYETELNILYKPIVTIEDENLTVTAGDQVSLECIVEANPMNMTLVKWFHNEEVINSDDDRFEDGNPENPSLTINPVQAEDAGDYYCLAQNQIGQSRSNSSVSLLVIFPPTVQIRRDPTGILAEEDEINVTLHCELLDGSPLELTRVYWFMNNELIRQLPDPHCDQLENEDSETLFDEQFISEAGDYELGSGLEGSGIVDIGSGMELGSGFNQESDVGVKYLCDVDPTELFLQHVTRDFSGYFSCSGSNIAGEGLASEPVHLDVLYIPGQSLITQVEDAQKGGSVTLLCDLEDQGNPVAAEYMWRRDEEPLDETTSNLTLDNLSANSQGALSCAAVNELGQGEVGTLELIIFAPPSFTQSLPEEATFISDDLDLNLQCQVECSPLCSIKWMKNEVLIDNTDDKYIIEVEVIPYDIDTNQFQSVISKLSWNLENLADNRLDHNELNFTISCFVEETATPVGISSSSYIEVKYAPENIEISTTFVSIEENEIMEPIFCYGEGVPEPSVVWGFEDKEITSENTLDFVEPMKREQGGVYSCHIENEHGKEVVNVTVDVLYKPECLIDYRLEEEEVVLICNAEANPEEVKLWWEKNNITFDVQSADNTLENEVRLKVMNESAGVYLCHVSNSVGQGEPCMIDLTMDMMTYGLSEEVVVILIAVAGSVIVLLIIIIITACLYCGEKKDKKGAAPLKKHKSKSPLLKDDKVHADSSFYENLPFKGLRSPPKQVVDDRNSDMMDYADADYLDIYANGPLKYRETSEKNATLRRQKIEQRKSDLL